MMNSESGKKQPFRAILVLLTAVLLMVLGTGAADAYGAESNVSRYTGQTYKHSSVFANAIIVDGVDVSYVQKTNVNWRKAKADGVDFAIIRVGARGYGQAGKLIVDDYYRQNIQAAKDAGLMVGVYFFSQALDPLEAYAEAAYTLELIEGIELDLPVYMDYEFSGGSAGRLTNAQLSRIRMTENAEKFCETIEAAGYEAGFYANRNFLNNTVDGNAIGRKWPVWMASYDTFTEYTGDYHMWQYSSSGNIDGYSGRIDVNFMYLNEMPAPSSALSLANATATVMGPASYTYNYGSIHEPAVYVSLYGSSLTEGTDYKKFYLKNSNAGTAYVLLKGMGNYTDYKLVPYTILPSTGIYGIKIEPVADRQFNGTVNEPADLTITDAYGNKLIKGLDYTFTTVNSTNVGTATVHIEFIGNYSGTKTAAYRILPGEQNLTAEKLSYEVSLNNGPFMLEGIVNKVGSKLTYSSGNEAVAAVDQNGNVTPVGVGSTVITVTADGSGGYKEASLTIAVTVTRPAQIIVTNANSYTKKRLAKSFFLGAASEAGTELTYVSTDTAVAKVREDGRVMLMGPGTCEIVITAPETEGFAAAEKRVPVTVNDMEEAEYEALYEKTKAGIENTKIVSLKAYPERKSVKLTWKKSNSGFNVDYYQVWRSTKKSSGFKKIYTTATDTKKYYVNSKGLTPGSTYWYKVRGVRNLEGKLVYTPFKKIQVVMKK